MMKSRVLIVLSILLLLLSAAVVPAAGDDEMIIYQDPRYVEDDGSARNRGVVHGPESVNPESNGEYHGWALKFDGESDWIDISSDSDAYDSDSFTVALWVKSSSEKKQCLIADWGQEGMRYRLRLRNDTKESRLLFTVWGQESQAGLSLGGNFTEWHHIAATYDSQTGQQALYVDGGASSTQREKDLSLRKRGKTHLIGRDKPGKPAWRDYVLFFKGYVGLTEYYDSALSAEEVSSLSNDTDIEKTPVSSWSMEGKSPGDTSETLFLVYPFALGASLILLAYYSYSKFEDKYDFEVK